MTRNGKKIVPFPPWQTKTTTGYEKSFVRLGISQLLDESAFSLSPGAFQTYCYMLLAAQGKEDFIYPQSQYLKVCASEAFERRKKELILKGFIGISEKGNNIIGKATLYRFSEAWKDKPNATTLKR